MVGGIRMLDRGPQGPRDESKGAQRATRTPRGQGPKGLRGTAGSPQGATRKEHPERSGTGTSKNRVPVPAEKPGPGSPKKPQGGPRDTTGRAPGAPGEQAEAPRGRPGAPERSSTGTSKNKVPVPAQKKKEPSGPENAPRGGGTGTQGGGPRRPPKKYPSVTLTKRFAKFSFSLI